MYQELIGATIEIIGATNKVVMGKKGKVIDETKNTITIETSKGEKKILKNGVTIRIINDKHFQEKIIDGKELLKRSYERIK